jgi:hypothetical protein
MDAHHDQIRFQLGRVPQYLAIRPTFDDHRALTSFP